MAPSRPFKIPWLGIVLIVIGLLLLMGRLGYYHPGFWMIFWPLVLIFGFVKVLEGFSGNNSGRIFFGTICFLYGVYFVLRSTGMFEFRFHIFVPATFIILGFAFIMVYLNALREWVFLLPAILLMGTGIAYLLSDAGYFSPWDVSDMVRTYWPVILILVGVAIMLRWRSRVHPAVNADPGPSAGPGTDPAGPV